MYVCAERERERERAPKLKAHACWTRSACAALIHMYSALEYTYIHEHTCVCSTQRRIVQACTCVFLYVCVQRMFCMPLFTAATAAILLLQLLQFYCCNCCNFTAATAAILLLQLLRYLYRNIHMQEYVYRNNYTGICIPFDQMCTILALILSQIFTDVCMYICMYVCVCTYSSWVHMYAYVCIRICMYAYVCVCMCVYLLKLGIKVRFQHNLHVCMYVCMYACMHVCMYATVCMSALRI
jgi:hypothetical protein